MVLFAGNTVWSISERTRGVCVDTLYKSTYTLLYFTLHDREVCFPFIQYDTCCSKWILSQLARLKIAAKNHNWKHTTKFSSQSYLGLITAASSSSDSQPAIRPFVNFSAYPMLSSSSAATENGCTGLSPAVVTSRHVKQSLNFQTSVLKLEFKFHWHTSDIRILDEYVSTIFT